MVILVKPFPDLSSSVRRDAILLHFLGEESVLVSVPDDPSGLLFYLETAP
jgi:hypothetical protein